MTTLAYSDLTDDQQRAAQAVCGDVPLAYRQTWDSGLRAARFTVTAMPACDAKAFVMNSGDLRERHHTFTEYHQAYLANGDTPDHGDSRWPCVILTGGEEEGWFDGWHRFHSYIEAGDQTIPTLTIHRAA